MIRRQKRGQVFHVNLGENEPETRPALKYTKTIAKTFNYTTATMFNSKNENLNFFATPIRRPTTANNIPKIHKTTNDQRMDTNGSIISLSDRGDEEENSPKLRKKSSNIRKF